MRNGSPNSNSCSPYKGLNNYVTKIIGAETPTATIAYFFEKQSDFDADVRKPMYLTEEDTDGLDDTEIDKKISDTSELYLVGSTYDPGVDTIEGFKEYARRLEDIHFVYLQHYIENLRYSIVNYNDNGLRAYKMNNQLQLCIVDAESDTAISPADLEMDESPNAVSTAASYEAYTKLPYVLKRLNNLSCHLGVHMISFIRAYDVAYRKHKHNSGVNTSFKQSAVITEGYYLCDSCGNPTKLATVSAKNPRTAEAFEWIIGATNKLTSYHADVASFREYVRMLNIELSLEDMPKYNAEFYKSLVVTTLTPDDQYNPAVYEKLKGNKGTTLDQMNVRQSVMSRFQDSLQSNSAIQDRISNYNTFTARDIDSLNRKLVCDLYKVAGKSCNPGRLHYVDGFLYNGTVPCVVDEYLFIKKPISAQPSGNCLIHELGFVVLANNPDNVQLIDIFAASANFENMNNQSYELYKQEGWTAL